MGSEKAIAALVTSLVSFVVVQFGLEDIEGELSAAIVTVVTAAAVWLIPNSTKA